MYQGKSGRGGLVTIRIWNKYEEKSLRKFQRLTSTSFEACWTTVRGLFMKITRIFLNVFVVNFKIATKV
jgi:hypothetical protein